MKANTVSFEVEGLGKFTTYKQSPAKVFFVEKETEIAKILGGRIEYARMRAELRRCMNPHDANGEPKSQEQVEKDSIEADMLYGDLFRAQKYVELKDLLTDVPEGFVLNKLNPEQFDSLVGALGVAREPFREDRIGKPDAKAEVAEPLGKQEENKE